MKVVQSLLLLFAHLFYVFLLIHSLGSTWNSSTWEGLSPLSLGYFYLNSETSMMGDYSLNLWNPLIIFSSSFNSLIFGQSWMPTILFSLLMLSMRTSRLRFSGNLFAVVFNFSDKSTFLNGCRNTSASASIFMS